MKMIKQTFSKYKNCIFNLLCAFITYLSLLIYLKNIFSYNSYNFLYLLVFFALIAFYNKYQNKFKSYDERTKKYSLTLSLLLSLILIIGSIVSSHVSERTGLIFDFHNIIYVLVGVLGFWLFFRIGIAIILQKLPNLTNTRKNGKMSKRMFFLVFIIFIIGWIPYFLRYFPAIMTPDSYYVIHFVNNLELNDFHAFGHTWFFGIFYLIGKFLFHSMNGAVAFYSVIQMIICSLLLTYMIKFLYERQIKPIYIFIIGLFLALSPLFAMYSITLWRDVLFSYAFIILFISLYKFVENEYEFKIDNILMYIISVLVILFFRNNGIYVFLLFIPFFIIFIKKHKGIIAIGNLCLVALYFIIKGPIFNYFDVTKTTSVEAFSIPLQQISRVIVNDGNIGKEDYEYISKVLDIQKIKETYTTTVSDPVKRAANNKLISANKTKFFITWLKIGIDNPRIYIDSYFCSTLGYWYPDVIYWATAGESKSIFKDVDVYTKPLAFSNVDFSVLTSRKIPLSSFLWSIGTMFILLLCSTFIMAYKNKQKYLLAYIPLYCLWLSLMVASPVFAELRYIFALFTCMPLVIFTPFVKEQKANN